MLVFGVLIIHIFINDFDIGRSSLFSPSEGDVVFVTISLAHHRFIINTYVSILKFFVSTYIAKCHNTIQFSPAVKRKNMDI